MNISVVVPVYNSEQSLRSLAERLKPVLEEAAGTFELILVNDGSRDNSWSAICELAQKYDWVRGINLMRNYGQHNALLCGIREARFEVTVTLDDDLQHPPEEIPKLLAKLDEGHDVVYGAPEEQRHGAWRDFASLIAKWTLQKAMGAKTARNVSAFRAFRTRLRDAFADYRSSFVSVDVLLTWGTTRFAAIFVRHDPRELGVSQYTFRKLIVHTLNMMTGFSTWPLQLAGLTGFAFTLFGLVLFLYVLIRFLVERQSVPGFPFLASTIAIFSGAQLFAIGVIGEYIGRIHTRSIERPVYVVRSFSDPKVRGDLEKPDGPS